MVVAVTKKFELCRTYLVEVPDNVLDEDLYYEACRQKKHRHEPDWDLEDPEPVTLCICRLDKDDEQILPPAWERAGE